MAAVALVAVLGAGNIALGAPSPITASDRVCLDFDDLAAGSALTVYQGVTFTNNDGGLTVQSAYPGPVFTAPMVVLPNDISQLGNRTRATFSGPVSNPSVTLGDFNADPDDLFLEAYDASGTLIGSTATSIPAALVGGVDLTVSASNVAYIEFWGEGLFSLNNVYFDNVCFDAAHTKAEILIDSGVPGNGLGDAPGLQEEFNPKSKAAGNAGKKS